MFPTTYLPVISLPVRLSLSLDLSLPHLLLCMCVLVSLLAPLHAARVHVEAACSIAVG